MPSSDVIDSWFVSLKSSKSSFMSTIVSGDESWPSLSSVLSSSLSSVLFSAPLSDVFVVAFWLSLTKLCSVFLDSDEDLIDF